MLLWYYHAPSQKQCLPHSQRSSTTVGARPGWDMWLIFMRIYERTVFAQLRSAYDIIYFHPSKNYTNRKHKELIITASADREPEWYEGGRRGSGVRIPGALFVCACRCLCSSIRLGVLRVSGACAHGCRAPSALPGARLIFTRLHYPWQMEYICVRLLRGERVGQINVFN